MAEKKIPLSPTNIARANALASAILEQAEVDQALARASSKALAKLLTSDQAQALLELDDESLAVAGWTRDEVTIAFHALKGPKEVPYGLRMAHERYVARVRVRGETDDAPSAVAAIVALPPTQALAPVEVDPEETE